MLLYKHTHTAAECGKWRGLLQCSSNSITQRYLYPSLSSLQPSTITATTNTTATPRLSLHPSLLSSLQPSLQLSLPRCLHSSLQLHLRPSLRIAVHLTPAHYCRLILPMFPEPQSCLINRSLHTYPYCTLIFNEYCKKELIQHYISSFKCFYNKFIQLNTPF